MRLFLGQLLHFFLRPMLPNGVLRQHLGRGKIDHHGLTSQLSHDLDEGSRSSVPLNRLPYPCSLKLEAEK